MRGCLQRMEIVDRTLSRYLSRLGHQVGRRPGIFVVVSTLVALLAATGFQQLHQERAPEKLFAIEGGEAELALQMGQKYFPVNFSRFDQGRKLSMKNIVRIIAVPRDGGSMLRAAPLHELRLVDDLVNSVQLRDRDTIWKYADVCAQWQGECLPRPIVRLDELSADLENGRLNLTYPVWIDEERDFRPYILIEGLGALNVSADQRVTSAAAGVLLYYTNDRTSFGTHLGTLWEDEVLKALQQLRAEDLQHIDISYYMSETLSDELERNFFSILPYMIPNYVMMGVVCVLMSLSRDWVRGKPVVMVLGVFSACLATAAAFGLLIYCGATFNILNMASPFLALAIGVDDTFVVLSAWRRTSLRDPVPQRMAAAYAECAVSITITSLTDMFSFWVGLATPIPSVQTFCLYTGVSVIFTYLWHLTFFGGCLALSGYAEQANRHSVVFKRVLPKSEAGAKSRAYRLFCTGGISQQDPDRPEDNRPHAVMTFLRDRLAHWLNKSSTKVAALALFALYLVGAIWGCTTLDEGLEKEHMVGKHSYANKFLQASHKYFYNNPYRIQVMIEGDHDYHSAEVQQRLEELTRSLEALEHVDADYTDSWLRDWTVIAPDVEVVLGLNMSTRAGWLAALKQTALHDNSLHGLDVVFDESGEHFLATRFLIQCKNMLSSKDEKALLLELRDVCDKSEFKCKAFNSVFVLLDQYLYVRSITIQSILAATAIMCAISLVLIPHPACSVWVALSIFSIEVGVVGYMSWWNVNLDSISMVNLIMCIGFSVDFSAHISYSYMTAKGTAEQRVRQCLYAVGFPIIQGGVTTIVGMFLLVFTDTYIFQVFFKSVVLVILLGLLHGLILIPISLSVLGPGSQLYDHSCRWADGGQNDDAADCRDVNGMEEPQIIPVADSSVALVGFTGKHQNNNSQENGKVAGAERGLQDEANVNVINAGPEGKACSPVKVNQYENVAFVPDENETDNTDDLKDESIAQV